MNQAQTALDGLDYSAAISWAGKALELKTDDAAAIKIKDGAQHALDTLSNIVRQASSAYQQVTEAFKNKVISNPAALAFSNAVNLADKVLEIHKEDATAQKIKTDILHQLDAELVTLLESFNVSVPTEIKSAGAGKTSRLPSISDEDKNFDQSQASFLENLYPTGHWLNGPRQASLAQLHRAITIWP